MRTTRLFLVAFLALLIATVSAVRAEAPVLVKPVLVREIKIPLLTDLLALSPNTDFIAVLQSEPVGKSVSTTIRILDSKTGLEKFQFPFHVVVGTGEPLLDQMESAHRTKVIFSPSSQQIFVGRLDGFVEVYDVQSGKRTHRFAMKGASTIHFMDIAQGAKALVLAVTTNLGTSLLDSQTGKLISDFPFSKAPDELFHGKVALNRNATLLADFSPDDCVRVFDLQTGKEIIRRGIHFFDPLDHEKELGITSRTEIDISALSFLSGDRLRIVDSEIFSTEQSSNLVLDLATATLTRYAQDKVGPAPNAVAVSQGADTSVGVLVTPNDFPYPLGCVQTKIAKRLDQFTFPQITPQLTGPDQGDPQYMESMSVAITPSGSHSGVHHTWMTSSAKGATFQLFQLVP